MIAESGSQEAIDKMLDEVDEFMGTKKSAANFEEEFILEEVAFNKKKEQMI